MSASPQFWNRLADKYAAQPVADPEAYEYKLTETRKLLRPDMNVLEFGCGTGTTALKHAPLVAHIDAVDFSDRMIEICRQKAADQKVGNVSFSVNSIETLDAPTHSYDMVMGHSVLHLVPDHVAAIAKVATLLKPGGYFVSSTACMGDMMAPIRWLLGLATRIGVAPPLAVFTGDTLILQIEAQGFVVEQSWRPKPGAALFVIARRA